MKSTRYTAEFKTEAVKQITERGHGLVVATILLLLTVSHACAGQPTENSLDWDCWIQGDNDPVSINCILDRDSMVPQPADAPEADLEKLLLDRIHSQIHAGDTTELGKLISNNVNVIRRGSIWSIYINTIPYDSSWEEGRPQMLVRSLLCLDHLPCTVDFKRPP